MKYIILEDEPLAAERVRQYAGKLPDLEYLVTCENAATAIEFLRSNTVDLIFLDINIGEISGIQFLEIARPECAVIILTAYQDHAIKGFEMDVADYLLKPFNFERFCQAVERARVRIKKPGSDKVYIFVKTQYRLEKVMLSELLYIEGARDYRRIYTIKQELMTLETFGELEKKLPASRFMRIHKSYLIALRHIHSLERDFIRIGSQLLPVSDTYKKSLLATIKKQ